MREGSDMVKGKWILYVTKGMLVRLDKNNENKKKKK